MKVKDEKSILKSMMTLVFLASLLVGCAKELPEDVSDDIQETAHSLNLFKGSVEISSDDEEGTLALQSKEEVNDIVAVNELGLRSVTMTKGPSELAAFFTGLKLESSFPGEKFTVHFAFNSKALIAYAEVKNQRVTLVNSQLTKAIKTFSGAVVNAYPIFQYNVDAFGILERATNALNEETRTVIFKTKTMDSATHIKIDPKQEKRKNAGLRFSDLDKTNIIFNKQRLSQRLFKTKDLVSLFNDTAQLQRFSTLGDKDFSRVKIVGDKLFIQKPTKKSDLTSIELAALLNAAKDPRINMCDKTIAQAVGIEVSSCVLRPYVSIAISHVELQTKEVDGVTMAEIDAPKVLSKASRSKLVQIDLDEKMTLEMIGKDINMVDEILTNKEKHFDVNAEYIYVPMTMGTPREVIAADPFYQGKEKIVKMKFSKDGLEIFEIEKDERFQDNDLNNSPVFTIPGKHLDFKCTENSDDECIGGDTVDTDKSWDQKRFFVPSLDNLKTVEINPLDVMTVESDNCLIKVDTQLVSHTIKKGVLNIELEKTYKTSNSWRCIAEHYFDDTENMTGFSKAGFKVRFFYSIVDIKSLASKDYTPVAYPIPDHDEFGFFKDKISKLSSDFDRQRKENNYRLNRWNPNKKVITYHLSDTFDKPKNKLIKDATYKAFEGMNRSLKMANTGLQLELKEPSGKKSGDLRNSMIVLIDDPLSNGLLGYAPTVTNPRTGEIIQGHVNMYSGVLTSIVRHNWEGMVDFTIEKAQEEKKLESLKLIKTEKLASAEKSKKEKSDTDKSKLLKTITNKRLLQKALEGGPRAAGHVLGNDLHHRVLTNKVELITKNTKKAQSAMKRRLRERQVRVSDRDDSLEHLTKFEKLAHKKQVRLERFAANNALSDEAYKIAHTVKQLIPGIKEIKDVFKEDGTLKRWSELTEVQKKAATDIIVPYTYSATLVHEVGHGLGLRHNFIASKDAANYWTEEEAHALGLEHAPAYSSVMDYAFDSLNESTVFGKYDIAALRFGYAREVQLNRSMTANGELPEDVKPTEFVKVESTLNKLSKKIEEENAARSTDEETPALVESLAGYQFCTDSNAGLSASCNRFDEGSNLVEIVNHYISKYETYYKYRNFRDGRDTFQAEGLGGYAIARYNEFNRIRGIFEEWEFFAGIFGEELMVQGCGPAEVKLYPICKDINERRDSVLIAGDFFLNILKTPDHTCALAKAEAPEVVVESKTLFSIYDDIKFTTDHVTKTCFDQAVKTKVAEDGFVVVGEAGKFLNGFKDNSDSHIYSNDRAVRGVWVDKVFALKALLQRESGRGLTETNHMAMVSHSGISPKIGNFLNHLILGDDLIQPVLFTKEDGSLFEHKYAIDLEYSITGPQRGVAWLADFFNMAPSGSSKLLGVLLSNAKQFGLTYGEENGQESHNIVNLFTVRKFKLGQARDLTDLEYILLEDTIFAANENNALASTMITSFKVLEILKDIDPALIAKVANARINPTLPDGLSEVELASLTLDVALLKSLVGAIERGIEVELPFLVERFGEEQGTKIFNAYKLGLEGLTKLIGIQESLGQAPDLATEVEVKLYNMEIEELVGFLNGSLEKSIERYEQVLPYLPEMVHFR